MAVLLWTGQSEQVWPLYFQVHQCLARVSSVNTNVTGQPIIVVAQGAIYFSWYLNVYVLDSVGQNVPLANVTVFYPNATVAE
jgi:hypothetical protein